MKIIKQFTALLMLVFLIISCRKEDSIPYTPVSLSKEQAFYNLFYETDGLFYVKNGWIGGDGAFSIPLSSQKTLWLFGDSWDGTIINNKRTHIASSAHNTIAIQDGINPTNSTLNFYFGNAKDAFFKPDNNIGFLWPMHGTMIGSELYIFFSHIDTSSTGFGFKSIGSRLIKISNPLDHPTQWQITQYQIPHSFFNTANDIIYGTAIVQKDNYIYIFGSDTDYSVGNRFLLLSRVKQDSITNFSSWRFYKQGQWQSSFHTAERLTDQIGAEFSVSFQPQNNKFVLITTELGFSKNINIHYSDSLWGNWTSPVTVYECPEVNWGSSIYCYAAKGHPEISENNELIITYVASSTNLTDILNNARLSRPQFVKINF